MSETYSDWLRLFPYAVLMIVIASWVLYHFVAPANWRDWAGAGLVQAFIIALYAAMYGFPLTISFMTSVLPVDLPPVPYRGHLRATLLGYGQIGAGHAMAMGYAFVVTGLVRHVHGWTKVFSANGRKNGKKW